MKMTLPESEECTTAEERAIYWRAYASVVEDERNQLHRTSETTVTALRRIISLEEKNVPKYAQQIAKEALSRPATTSLDPFTIEACAKVVEPKRPRPCDCEPMHCSCHNQGDAHAVASWDAEQAMADAIRALTATKPAHKEEVGEIIKVPREVLQRAHDALEEIPDWSDAGSETWILQHQLSSILNPEPKGAGDADRT